MGELQKIYVNSIKQLLERLNACKIFLKIYEDSKNEYYLESALLQLRKVLELLAFASIAPNHIEYQRIRSLSEENKDYRKDFNAKKIIQILVKVNKDFYPVPLKKPYDSSSEKNHFERKTEGFFNIKNFEKLYGQLGGLLHADNPWGYDKNFQNSFIKIPSYINEIESLLALYFTVIRTNNFTGIWLIETNQNPIEVFVTVARADGEFIIQ